MGEMYHDGEGGASRSSGLYAGGAAGYNCTMQKDSRLFEDMAKMISGAAGAAMDMRREFEAMVTDKIERFMGRGQFVTREEFEVVKAMAEKARAENEALRAEIGKLTPR